MALGSELYFLGATFKSLIIFKVPSSWSVFCAPFLASEEVTKLIANAYLGTIFVE